MKTVRMLRNFVYRPHPRKEVWFLAGCTYSRVLETAARQIECSGAGRIVDVGGDADVIDASDAFRRKGKLS